MFCRSLTVRKITSTTWYWTHDGESWRAGHLIRYWIPFFPGSKILIAKQYSKKKDVPWSIFIIKGVILLNSSTNLILNCFNRKLTTKQTYNLLRLFRPNTPKKVFLIKQLEQKKKKKTKKEFYADVTSFLILYPFWGFFALKILKQQFCHNTFYSNFQTLCCCNITPKSEKFNA